MQVIGLALVAAGASFTRQCPFVITAAHAVRAIGRRHVEPTVDALSVSFSLRSAPGSR